MPPKRTPKTKEKTKTKTLQQVVQQAQQISEVSNVEVKEAEIPNVKVKEEVPNIEVPNIEVPNVEVKEAEVPNVEENKPSLRKEKKLRKQNKLMEKKLSNLSPQEFKSQMGNMSEMFSDPNMVDGIKSMASSMIQKMGGDPNEVESLTSSSMSNMFNDVTQSIGPMLESLGKGGGIVDLLKGFIPKANPGSKCEKTENIGGGDLSDLLKSSMSLLSGKTKSSERMKAVVPSADSKISFERTPETNVRSSNEKKVLSNKHSTCPHSHKTNKTNMTPHHHSAPRKSEDTHVSLDITLEDMYKGKTIRINVSRYRFSNSSRPSKPEKGKVKLTVFVHAGAEDGKVYTYEKEGSVDRPGMEPGDIMVVLHQLPNERFERIGSHIFIEDDISLGDALEYQRAMTHLDGRVLMIQSNPADILYSDNSIRKVEGEGMPIDKGSKEQKQQKQGDLFVRFNIELPEEITAEQRAILIKAFPTTSQKDEKGKENSEVKMLTKPSEQDYEELDLLDDDEDSDFSDGDDYDDDDDSSSFTDENEDYDDDDLDGDAHELDCISECSE